MNKQITIVLTANIKTEGNLCATEEITWSFRKAKGPKSCKYNGTTRYGQGVNMSSPEEEWWDFDYCSLFHKDLNLNKEGYPKRCKDCLGYDK